MTYLIESDGFILNVADISTVQYVDGELTIALISDLVEILSFRGNKAKNVFKKLKDYAVICNLRSFSV